MVNHLPNGTIAEGAPGSPARKAAEILDVFRGMSINIVRLQREAKGSACDLLLQDNISDALQQAHAAGLREGLEMAAEIAVSELNYECHSHESDQHEGSFFMCTEEKILEALRQKAGEMTQ